MISGKIRFFLFALLIVFAACTREEEFPLAKDYPVLETKDPVQIDVSGVTLMARVVSTGSLTIEDFGFVLESNGKEFRLSLANKPIGEIFEARVTADLKKETQYYYRAFLQINDLLILGNSKSFISRGTHEPKLTGFKPKSGNSGDTITISGENFSLFDSRIQVKIGDDLGEVVMVHSDEVKFLVPEKLTRSGKVAISLTSGDTTILSEDHFLIEGHQVESFHPQRGIIGETEIVITGSGFDREIQNNQVSIGEYPTELINAEENKIIVKLPYTMEPGDFPVMVTVNGKTFTSDEKIKIISRWSKRNDFPASPRVGGYFAVIDGMGYLIGGRKIKGCCVPEFLSEVWKYDIENDQWTQLEDFPGEGRHLGVGFVLNNKVYYGLGKLEYQGFSDFWEFDPGTESWVQLNDFPDDGKGDAIYFSLNNVGYLIGGDRGSGDRAVWRYERHPDSWTRLGDVNYSMVRKLDGRDGFFQYNYEGYIIPIRFSNLEEYKILKFDPSYEGFLKEEADFPLGYRNGRLFSFIIDDVLFIGGDDYETEDQKPDFWKYDFGSKEWVQIESFLGGERSFVNSFSYNGIGYAMLGLNGICCVSSNTKIEPGIWTYDPAVK